MTDWILLIRSEDLTNEQKRLIKEYLYHKKIKHYGWIDKK